MIALLMALFLGLTVFATVIAVFPSQSTVEPLRQKRSSNPVDAVSGLRELVKALEPTLNKLAPNGLERLDQTLVLAGRPMGRVRAVELVGVAVIAAIASAVVYAIAFGSLFGLGGLLLGLVLGFACPIVIALSIVRRSYRRRARRLNQQFPYFLDFLVMIKESGENLSMALRLYVGAAGTTELGGAMRTVVDGIQNHREGLKGALMDFRDNCPSEMGRSTIRSILTAEEMGARSTEMLRDVARDMRGTRYEQAEKVAERLRAVSTLPAVVMFTGAFVMILAGSLAKLITLGG